MTVEVKFAYVCRLRFDELPGFDESVRHCNQCDLDVTNLDSMTDADAAAFLLNTSRKSQRICVSATAYLPDATACRGTAAPLMATAGSPVPESIFLIDVTAPEQVTTQQAALLMKILKLPNRLALARIFKQSSTVRLGAYGKWKLRERLTDPLDSVGLTWTMSELRHGDAGYWEQDVKDPP